MDLELYGNGDNFRTFKSWLQTNHWDFEKPQTKYEILRARKDNKIIFYDNVSGYITSGNMLALDTYHSCFREKNLKNRSRRIVRYL